MDEIRIFYDREKSREIIDEIFFEKIMAGEITKKSIFIVNNIKYPMDIKVELSGEDILLTKSIQRLSPGKMEKVEFEFTPKITRMKPLKAKLNVKVEYVITG